MFPCANVGGTSQARIHRCPVRSHRRHLVPAVGVFDTPTGRIRVVRCGHVRRVPRSLVLRMPLRAHTQGHGDALEEEQTREDEPASAAETA